MPDASIKEKIKQILDVLKRDYGVVQEQHRHDPVSVLVQTILSQNTSDTNSEVAFRGLLASFNSWEEVANASIGDIGDCIRCGGLWRIKAQRIKQVLREILQKRGRLELDFLSQLTSSEAEDWLQQLKGVGLKTARCVLLFSLRVPTLPVDTHILRVSKRLGLISFKASADDAHEILAEVVMPEDVYQFHVLMIEHGRKICRARYFHCQDCALKKLCISFMN